MDVSLQMHAGNSAARQSVQTTCLLSFQALVINSGQPQNSHSTSYYADYDTEQIPEDDFLGGWRDGSLGKGIYHQT